MAYIYKEDMGSKKSTKDALEKTRRGFEDGNDVAMELNRVWEKIKQDAITICPKDTGSLSRTIRVVKIPLGVSLGGLSQMKDITIFDRSIIAGDLMMINPKTKRPVNYAGFVHDGFIRHNGVVVNGRPFLTEALALNDEELNRAIDRALGKLGKKFEESA